jgi:hypothetical protein
MSLHTLVCRNIIITETSQWFWRTDTHSPIDLYFLLFSLLDLDLAVPIQILCHGPTQRMSCQTAAAHSTEWGLLSRIGCSHCTVQSNTWARSRFSTGNTESLNHDALHRLSSLSRISYNHRTVQPNTWGRWRTKCHFRKRQLADVW